MFNFSKLARNSGLWPQLPGLMGPELLRQGWEDKHSLPQGLQRARVLGVHRSSNGWEAGGSEWERDTSYLNEWTNLLAIWASGSGPSASVHASIFWAANRIKQKGFPRFTDRGQFLFKSQSQIRRTERTPADGALSQGWGGAEYWRRFLPYAGRAHWSQGQLPPGRSRVSAGPCPASSPLLPALPAPCVSAFRSSVRLLWVLQSRVWAPRGGPYPGSALDSSRSGCGAVLGAFSARSDAASPRPGPEFWDPVRSKSPVSWLQDAGRDAGFQSSQWSVRASFSSRTREAQHPDCVLRALQSRELISSERASPSLCSSALLPRLQRRSPAALAPLLFWSLDNSFQYVWRR